MGGPHVVPVPQVGIAVGDVVTAFYVAGLLADTSVRWLRQHWNRPSERQADARN